MLRRDTRRRLDQFIAHPAVLGRDEARFLGAISLPRALALMIAVHPFSGVVQPSAFDLSTGRLCVMASRHRAGLVLVTRDHLRSTLEA